MKKIGGIFLGVSWVGLQLIFSIVPSANAAACVNVSGFGATTLAVPELTKLQDQAIWVRMQTNKAEDKLFVEVNGSDCLDVGGYKASPNQWSWQSYRVGDRVTPLSFPQVSGNIIKLIGVSDGVKVDRILLTETSCVPADFGNNCQKSVSLQSSGESVTTLPSPSDKPLSGKIILSSTPSRFATQLKTVEYIVNGTVIQSSQYADPFDTGLLANGKYNVQIHTVLTNGEVFRESTVIDIHNPDDAFTPFVRWVKRNGEMIQKTTLAAGALLLSLVLFRLLRSWLSHRREMHHHGF